MEKTTAQLLEELNELRIANDQAALKAWKKSKALLLEQIDSLRPQRNANNKWQIFEIGKYNRNRKEVIGTVTLTDAQYRGEEVTGTFDLVTPFTPYPNGPRGNYTGYVKIQDENGWRKVRANPETTEYDMH